MQSAKIEFFCKYLNTLQAILNILLVDCMDKIPEEVGNSGFSLRACTIAILLTLFLLSTSSYIALKIGALPWPIIFSALIAGVILRFISHFSNSTNVHEINVAQAGGTIGGLLASGVVFTIPGILYLQQKGIAIGNINPFLLALVCVSAGILGILLSIPIRRVLIDEEKLPYPSGTAGAEVVKAEVKGGKNAFIIALTGLLIGLFALTREIYFQAGFSLTLLATLGIFLTLYPMPLAIGVGYILGKKASFNWFLGALVGWIIIIPYLINFLNFSSTNAISLVQNLGMGLVLGSGVGFFVCSVIPRARKIFSPLFNFKGVWYTRVTPFASIIIFLILYLIGIPLLASLLAVAGVWIMATVAARTTGETDIDPLEQFGIIVGLLCLGIYAGLNLGLGYLPAFLIVCFVSIACALAGDIGHDYKSAKIIGTKVKDIVKVDLIAAIFAGLLAPFVLEIIQKSYAGVMFTPIMPAPQAILVASSIFGFAYPIAFYFGFILAFLIIVMQKLINKQLPILPMVFGIGLFLGLTLGLLLAIGGIIRYIIDRKYSNLYYSGVLVAAGMMGGEGIAGFSLAALYVAGFSYILAAQSLMVILFVLLMIAITLKIRK